MRVETSDHTADGLLDELLVCDRLDIERLDGSEHVGELAQFVQRQRRTRVTLGDGSDAQADQDAGDRAGHHQGYGLE